MQKQLVCWKCQKPWPQGLGSPAICPACKKESVAIVAETK